MNECADSQPSGVSQKLFLPFVANKILTLIRMHIIHPQSISVTSLGDTFTISIDFFGVETHEFPEYHMGAYNTMLVEP